MKRTNHIHIKLLGLVALILLTIPSCVNEFRTEDFSFERLVVVDAAFTNEDKIQIVKLSYTTPLELDGLAPLTGANVWVENDLEEVINFTEQSPGTYSTLAAFQGIEGRSYKLVFVTEEGKRYESIAEPLVKSPPIEISERFDERSSGELNSNEQGLLFSVESEDQTGKAQFFRYEWNDAKQTIVPLPAKIRTRIAFDPVHADFDTLYLIPEERDLEVCYRFGFSNSLSLASTVGLTENRVLDMPIRFNPIDSLNFMNRYSMEVTQYAVSPQAYNYYRAIKQLNESNGSLFDRQQGVVRGNVKSLASEEEVVLGYFEVSGASKRREFYNPDEFNQEFTAAFLKISDICKPTDSRSDGIRIQSIAGDVFGTRTTWLVDGLKIYDFERDLIDPFSGTLRQAPGGCVDCRVHGKLVEKPAYWID